MRYKTCLLLPIKELCSSQDLLPQVQGVAYLHFNDTIDGGEFFFYPAGPGAKEKGKVLPLFHFSESHDLSAWNIVVVVPADANTGLVLNGVRVVHGVQRFLPGKLSPSVGRNEASLMYLVRLQLKLFCNIIRCLGRVERRRHLGGNE